MKVYPYMSREPLPDTRKMVPNRYPYETLAW
jgi:hypothetical protein